MQEISEKIKDDNIKKMFSLLFFILQNVFNMVVEVPRWTNAKMEVWNILLASNGIINNDIKFCFKLFVIIFWIWDGWQVSL